MKSRIKNKNELDEFLFDHAQRKLHIVRSIKSEKQINIAWQCDCGEKINIEYISARN